MDDQPLKIGIVAALPREAQAILPSAQRCSQIYSLGNDAWIAIAGEGRENAERACRRLLATGINALLSWGVAAALEPRLQAGTLLLPQKVIDATAVPKRKPSYVIDKTWRTIFLDSLQGRFPLCVDPIVSFDQPLNLKSRQGLFEDHKACAVDTDSAAIACCAKEAGIAFAVIRVVAAPANLRTITVAATSTGKPALSGLLLRPYEIPAFVKRGLYSRYALNVLRRAVLALNGRLVGAAT